MRALLLVSPGLLAIACAEAEAIDPSSTVDRGATDGVSQSAPQGPLAPNRAVLSGDCHECCAKSSALPGSALWLESLSPDGVLEVGDVASDAQGNALVTRASGEIIKLSADGTRLWSKPFGALVATDSLGDVYVAGTLDRPLELGTFTLTPLGDTDVYVVKLDPDGAVVYGLRLGESGNESVTGLAVDEDGNVVVSGGGLGTLKLDPDGRIAWRKSFHGHVAFDARRHVVLAGAFSRTLDFGGGPLTSAGGQDIFVAELDAAGCHVFSQRFGDAAADQRAQAVSVDAAGDILVSGVFDGSVDFGGGPLVSDAGDCDVSCELAGFVVKLDSDGHHVFSQARFPVRALVGAAHDSRGDLFVSGSVPSDEPPYHVPLLIAFDSLGNERYETTGWPGAGAGHRVAVDPCDNVFWTLSLRPSDATSERSYVAKLAP